MTERQKLLGYAALVYAQSNVHDLNETFVHQPDGEENGDQDISLAGQVCPMFAADEFMEVIPQFLPAIDKG
jgi:hypothetical protein